MSWEHAQRPRRLGRWLLALGVLGVFAGGVVAAAANREPRGGTLAVRPTAQPETAPESEPSRAPVERPSAEPVRATAGTGPLLLDNADFTIVAGSRGGWRVIDVATGDVTAWRMTGLTPRLSQTLFVSGDDIVINSGLGPSDVYRVAPDGRAVRIARQRQAIPTVDAGDAVWVHDGLSDNFGGVVALVDADGSVRTRFELPTLTRPAIGTGEALLVTMKRGTVLASEDGRRPVMRDATVVAADSERVAHVRCDPTPVCRVSVGTYDEPDRHRVGLEAGAVPGGWFGSGLGAFSPDGTYLALPVFTQSARALITIIDTRTGAVVEHLRGSSQQFTSALAWSPDGSWLVFASGDRVDAWSPTSRAVVNVDGESARALAVR